MKKIRLYMVIITVNIILLVIPTHVIFGDTSNQTELKIEVQAEDNLYDIKDMKPGDWAPRSIVIKNNGKMNFEYDMQIENNGDPMLFNELILEINDHKSELFRGTFSEFNELAARELTAGDKEELKMVVRFPKHLGNEFQGLEANFAIIFTAEGQEGKQDHVRINGTVDSDDNIQNNGSKLPKTATSIFNILSLGGLLLLFGGLLIKLNRKVQN